MFISICESTWGVIYWKRKQWKNVTYLTKEIMGCLLTGHITGTEWADVCVGSMAHFGQWRLLEVTDFFEDNPDITDFPMNIGLQDVCSLFGGGMTTELPIWTSLGLEFQLDLSFFDFNFSSWIEGSLDRGSPKVSMNFLKVLVSSLRYPASSRDWHTPRSLERSNA